MPDVTVLRGGTIVDGTGAPGRAGDVAISDGTIVGIGTGLSGDSSIDASGCVVAPGFIDIHTHYDAQVFWDPALTPSCYHGVTTVVAGNCGFSLAPTMPDRRVLIARTLEKVEDMDVESLAAGIPWDFATFPEYLASVDAHGSALNFAAFIGHTPLRIYVMGDEASSRTATPAEVDQMARLVSEAMDAGAAGFATSFAITHLGADGQPIPSRWADRAELVALFRAQAKTRRGVLGINGVNDQLHFSEIYDLQRELDIPITWTALLTSPTGSHLKALALHREGREKGSAVYPQVSPRPLTFSMNMVEPFTLNTSPTFAGLMAGSLDDRARAYGDPAWRQRVRDGWASGPQGGLPPRWETYELMESRAHPELVGQRLQTLAEERGVDEFDLLLDLALDEPSLRDIRVRAIVANDDDDAVRTLLQEDGCTLGLSDAGAHVSQLCDAPLATDLLATWVREKGVLSVEQAVHKLTQVQAELFGFAGRGVLEEGFAADIVVFDPDTVAPGPLRRINDFPAGAERLTADQPAGMRHLLVNGVQVIDDGQLQTTAVDARPGQLLSPIAR
jgi:N-acyl-D-aspartate/D-glutamate deacylase